MSPLRLLVAGILVALTVVSGCSRRPPARALAIPGEAQEPAPNFEPGGPSTDRQAATRSSARVKDSPTPASPSPTQTWIEELVRAGWDEQTAQRLVSLNEDWWAMLAEDNPELVRLQLAYLGKLPRSEQIASLLQRHPEVAGLLVSADDPSALARLLEGPDYPVLAGLFVSHAAPTDARELTRALERHRDLIVRLQRRGLLGSEAMFLSRKGGPGRSPVYETWLRNEVEKRLAGSDEALASFFHFVLDSGPFLRDRLDQDAAFRDSFPELWRKLSRVVGLENRREDASGALEHFLEEPGVWDVLALEDGERLLVEWGPLAVRLLAGPQVFPPKVRERVVEVLLNGDARAVEALLKFRQEPLFLKLLERPLSRPTRVAALQHLLRLSADAGEELYRMENMTAEGLARHVGPPAEGVKTWVPLYSAYAIYEKWQDGRDASALEWVLAAADTVATLLPASKAVTTSLAKTGETVTVQQAANPLKQYALTFAARALSRQAAKQLTAQRTARQTIHWGSSQLLVEVQREVRRVLARVDSWTSLDITRPLQFICQRSGRGRETFKRLTGLEVQLLLRPDARVQVHLLRKQVPEQFQKQAAWVEKAVRFFNPDPAAAAVRTSDKEGHGAEPRSAAACPKLGGKATSPEGLEESWRKNVSAWWLLHACGMAGQLR